ncbi:MAG: hypothetical protein HFE39_05850 [Clostridiales bacterium]|jgi:hypothetical protein|nr:hypothetical protein [Clostridiales bacterium]
MESVIDRLEQYLHKFSDLNIQERNIGGVLFFHRLPLESKVFSLDLHLVSAIQAYKLAEDNMHNHFLALYNQKHFR